MNVDLLIDLFNVGYNQISAPQYVQTVSSLEGNLVVLGRNFAKYEKQPPEFIFLDKDHTLNISEDMITCFGVFAKGRQLLLVDQYGQIIDIWSYPNFVPTFPVSIAHIPHLALH